MIESAPNQSRFYKRWTIQRKNKWKYLLLNGTVYWIIIGLIIVITTEIHHIGDINPWKWIISILLFTGVGLINANNVFKRNEKIYQTYFEDDPGIVGGVLILESKNQWVWENMTFSCEEENLLIIRNNIFWLIEEHPTEKQLSECMLTMEDDLLRLIRNKAFSAFAEGRKIKLQLYNNEDKTHPIAEKEFYLRT